MKNRLTALALILCLLVSLAACAGEAPDGEAVPSPAPSEETGAEPGPSEAPAETPSVEPSEEPSEAPSEEPSAEASEEPTAAPSETPAEAPAAAITAAEVYAAISKAAGVSYDDMSAYADAYYTSLTATDTAELVFRMPAMSDQLEEILVAKAAPGRVDAVKAACTARQAAMAEEAAFYGTTGAYVDSYRLVSQGDWVLFCVCADPAAAVNAFQNAVK